MILTESGIKKKVEIILDGEIYRTIGFVCQEKIDLEW
jgi:hypothetical protein